MRLVTALKTLLKLIGFLTLVDGFLTAFIASFIAGVAAILRSVVLLVFSFYLTFFSGLLIEEGGKMLGDQYFEEKGMWLGFIMLVGGLVAGLLSG